MAFWLVQSVGYRLAPTLHNASSITTSGAISQRSQATAGDLNTLIHRISLSGYTFAKSSINRGGAPPRRFNNFEEF